MSSLPYGSLPSLDKKTVSRDGTSVAFESTGQGPAVILVSGAMSTGATLAPLAVPLSDRFRVVVYDRRGRGESGLVRSTAAHTPPSSIADNVAANPHAGDRVYSPRP